MGSTPRRGGALRTCAPRSNSRSTRGSARGAGKGLERARASVEVRGWGRWNGERVGASAASQWCGCGGVLCGGCAGNEARGTSARGGWVVLGLHLPRGGADDGAQVVEVCRCEVGGLSQAGHLGRLNLQVLLLPLLQENRVAGR
eukprot:scaffold8583_cov119-Isochrysis_galbana.AAC.7